MKATIARGLGKNYRQESPLDWGYLTFAEPRRERVRLTAAAPRRRRDRGGIVKKILLQLDTDEHPSTFDAIVAHDADVDVLLLHGGVERRGRRAALVQDAFFTRGPDDLKNDRPCGSAARAWPPARRSSPRCRRRSSARSRSR